MKKLLIIIYLLCFGLTVFSNEKNVDKELNNNQNIMFQIKKINRSINSILCGSSILGISSVPTSIFIGLFAMQGLGIIDTDAITVFGETMIGISFVTMIIAGISVTIAGNRYYNKNKHSFFYDENHVEMIQKFFLQKEKNFKKISIVNAIILGISATITTTGIFLTSFGRVESLSEKELEQENYNENCVIRVMNNFYLLDYIKISGIFLSIFGSIGLAVCLPMMIASLAMSAWCKGQLAKLTPELSLSHDSKKDFTEGYSVRMGLRVRL